jgi:uncharacterized repeat protein (TIGR01451 family)
MKPKHKLLVLLSIIVCFFIAHTAFAETVTSLQLKVETDKQEYNVGEEITYKITVSNTSDLVAKNVVVTSSIPDGLKVTSLDTKVEGNKVTWNIAKINPKSDASLEFKAMVEKKVVDPVQPPVVDPVQPPVVNTDATKVTMTGIQTKTTETAAPKTGDDTNFLGYYILLGFSTGVLTVGIRGLRKKNITKELTALFVLVLILPTFSTALAETQNEANTETVTNTYKLVINNKEYVIATTATATMEEPPAPGTVSGKISNAINGGPVEGLTLKIREGENNTTGEVVKTVTTNADGNYEAVLLEGNYTIEISGEGFITTTINITVIGNQIVGDLNGAISPVFGEGIRVVLTWGGLEESMDLDSYLNGPKANYEDGRFVVYWSDDYYIDELNEVNLDDDDTDSYGPETVTVIKHISSGFYVYGVHNYTANQIDNALSNSGAKVDVYSGNKLLYTFYVPTNTDGNVWKVFEIHNGEINSINEIVYDEDFSGDELVPTPI